MNYPWYGYAAPPDDRWMQTMQALEKRVEELTGRLDAAEKKLTDLQGKPPVHVEYHFDQLKVSKLDGTLNIGLSPQAMKDIDSFEVPAPGMWTAAPAPAGAAGQPAQAQPGAQAQAAPQAAASQTAGGAELPGAIQDLQREAADDLDRNGPALLQSLCGQLRVDLDEQHRRMIIADVRAQLSPRVHHYARTSPYPAAGADEERRKWRRAVLDKTGRDVRIALTNYLQKFQLPDMENGEGEP